MKPRTLDSFDRYDAQPGRRYLALETDSPQRWLTFALLHPQFKAAETDNPEQLLTLALNHPLFKAIPTRRWVHLEHGFGKAVIWGQDSGND